MAKSRIAEISSTVEILATHNPSSDNQQQQYDRTSTLLSHRLTMGSFAEAKRVHLEGPMGSSSSDTTEEVPEGIVEEEDEDESKSQIPIPDESRSQSPPKQRRKPAALTFARTCLGLLALFAFLTYGTSVFSKSNERFPEQVVKLGEAIAGIEHKERKLPEGSSFVDTKPEDEPLYPSQKITRPKQKQDKGRRKRPHRKIKNHHPDVATKDSRRRDLQSKSGMGSFGSRSFSGSYSGSRRRTFNPTPTPSASPTRAPAGTPSAYPSRAPSRTPSSHPSIVPSAGPSVSETPSQQPSIIPSNSPSLSFQPSISKSPSQQPSLSKEPSGQPSITPSNAPSVSKAPSSQPSKNPSSRPSSKPTRQPSHAPSVEFRTFPPTISPTRGSRTNSPIYGSNSRSGMGGMMMGMMRGRSFSSLDQNQFDAELQDLIAFLPPDFLALFGNNGFRRRR